MYLRCPHCSNAFELIADLDTDEVTCPSCHTRLSVDEMLSEGYDEMSSVTVSATEVMPKPGEMVGHFRIEKEIGRGGFGSVFRAFDTRLERWVAIKIPRTRRMSRRQAELFMREAQAAAQMHDPNIVTIHEVGRDGDRVYIASELVEGDTLVEWMKAKPRGWREIADVMAIIARAMHRAHERGVIHRDLKPRNIMMDTHDKPRVTDFGLAKREDPAVITVTRRGDVIGTPAYMPPEQASGTADLVDRRGDVYSMGVMLYELVAGKRPFRGETDLLINEVIECRPTLPRSINNNIPADLEAICLKAMAREPNKRFATAGEMADELQRFVAGKPTLTRPPTSMQRAWYALSEHRVAATIAALSVAFAVSLLLYATGPAGAAPRYTILTEFSLTPADASVVIRMVDPYRSTGLVSQSDLPVRPSIENGICSVRLEPGLYVVELEHPSWGRQSFVRMVPQNTQDARVRVAPGGFSDPASGPLIRYQHSWWERLGERHIEWTGVQMKRVEVKDLPHRLADEALALFPGGSLVFSNNHFHNMDGSLLFPPTTLQLESFYLGVREVSIANFRRVMGFIPEKAQALLESGLIDENAPVVGVIYDDALEYCHRIGARLPTVHELTFAHIQTLTTANPHGANPEPTDSSNVVYVEGLINDRVEWTQDLMVMPYDRAVERGQAASLPPGMKLAIENCRVIWGGDVMGNSAPYFGADYFSAHPISTSHEMLGFRVARSK